MPDASPAPAKEIVTNYPDGAKRYRQLNGGADDYNNDQSPYKTLIAQIRVEYEIAYRAQASRIQLLLNRLRLFNNQRRDPDTVGDNLLFTIFQSVLSALYTDRMSVEFVGRSAARDDIAESLNNTAKFDYDEMGKAQVDYTWDWDTLFFGTGLVAISEFDRERMVPKLDNWDYMCTLHDPDAISVNGGQDGKGAARFFGREIMVRGIDVEDIPSVFDFDHMKTTRPNRSLFEQARQQRESAQGLNNQIKYDEKDMGVNARKPLLEWLTWWEHPDLTGGVPKQVLVWVGNDQQKVCRFKVLEHPYWPVVHRKLFPTAHQWDSVSIPDLTEDKQRLRAILLNLGIKQMKSGLFGMYLYDKNKIKNKADLNFDFDKQIPVDVKKGDSLVNTVQAMPRDYANLQFFNNIMQALDISAQRATSTPEMQMGVPTQKGGKKTATEVQKTDTSSTIHYSLSTRIWGWSEMEFWEQWYGLYEEHFKSRIDEKLVRINTTFGPKFKWIIRSDIISKTTPDVVITSKLVSDQQKAAERVQLLNLGQLIIGLPGSNIRYYTKKMAKLHGLSSDEVDRIIPPTPDELNARNENIALEDNKFVPIGQQDNDEEHLEEHAKGYETPDMIAHIAAHQHQRELKKSNPNLFPGQQQKQQADQQNRDSMGNTMGKVNKKKPNQPATQPGQMGMAPSVGAMPQ
jgi:hypothetical protein